MGLIIFIVIIGVMYFGLAYVLNKIMTERDRIRHPHWFVGGDPTYDANPESHTFKHKTDASR